MGSKSQPSHSGTVHTRRLSASRAASVSASPQRTRISFAATAYDVQVSFARYGDLRLSFSRQRRLFFDPATRPTSNTEECRILNFRAGCRRHRRAERRWMRRESVLPKAGKVLAPRLLDGTGAERGSDHCGGSATDEVLLERISNGFEVSIAGSPCSMWSLDPGLPDLCRQRRLRCVSDRARCVLCTPSLARRTWLRARTPWWPWC